MSSANGSRSADFEFLAVRDDDRNFPEVDLDMAPLSALDFYLLIVLFKKCAEVLEDFSSVFRVEHFFELQSRVSTAWGAASSPESSLSSTIFYLRSSSVLESVELGETVWLDWFQRL